MPISLRRNGRGNAFSPLMNVMYNNRLLCMTMQCYPSMTGFANRADSSVMLPSYKAVRADDDKKNRVIFLNDFVLSVSTEGFEVNWEHESESPSCTVIMSDRFVHLELCLLDRRNHLGINLFCLPPILRGRWKLLCLGSYAVFLPYPCRSVRMEDGLVVSVSTGCVCSGWYLWNWLAFLLSVLITKVTTVWYSHRRDGV